MAKQSSFLNNSLVELASGFNRSTNLELDYQNRTRLREIQLSPKFETGLIEIMDTVLEENSNQRVRVLSGSPGLGKSTFAMFLANLLDAEQAQDICVDTIKKANTPNIGDLKKKVTKFVKDGMSLLPVFLNGHMGNIEDAFLNQLGIAFDREGYGDDFKVILKNSSKKQYEVIAKWKKSYPNSYETYLELLESEGQETKEFEGALKRGTSWAREIFERIYLEVSGGAATKNASGDVLSVYKESLKVLAEYDINGIFVIYDEFGKYLEKGIHSPSSLNVQFIQDFAEFCDRSGATQCHLTLITHMSVSQYASQLPQTIQREWAKIEGRFQETSFYDRGTNYFNMIEKVFDKTIEDTTPKLYKKVKSYAASFTKKMKGVGLEDLLETKDVNEVIARTYPLHPVTLALLPFLSSKVAQNERTLYTFLTRDEDFSFRRFLENGLDESEMNFLYPSDLYQYFSPLIAKDTGVGGAYKVALVTDEALNKIKKDDKVGKEILCLAALSSILKNNAYAPLSEDFLHASFEGNFTKKEIDTGLKGLKDKKILFYNRILKQYELHQGSSIDVQEEIEKLKEAKLTSMDLVKIINRYYRRDFIIPKRYNFAHNVNRFYRVENISVQDLKAKKIETKPDYNIEDGIIYYVIPFDQDELELARKLVKESDRELIPFVLPKTFIECRRDIEELNALNALYSNKEIINSSPLVKKELDRHRDITISAIRSLLDTLVGKFKLESELFYTPKKIRTSVASYGHLQRKLGDIFEMEYSKSVDLNSELVNKHKLSGAVTMARKNMTDALNKNPGEDKFGLEKNGADVSLYKALSKIAKFEWNEKERRFTLKGRQIKVLFESYRKILIKHPKGLTYETLQDTLIQPPFGLRKGVIPYYLALFDKTLEHPINHYFDGEYVSEPDGVHYDLLGKHPKLCKVQYTEISKTKVTYLTELAKVYGVKGEATVGVILTGIANWRNKIPEYTKNSKYISKEGKKFLIFLDSVKEPDRFVFEKIPEAFGLTPISDKTTDKAIKELASKVKKTSDDTMKVYPGLINRMNAQLVENLQFIQKNCLSEEPVKYQKGMNLSELYQGTWKRFDKEVKNHPFNKITNQFIQRFCTFDTTKHPQYFIENLADALTGASPRHWDIKGESLFEYALTQAQNEIEMVCEFLSESFNGESAIAFINHESGHREFLRLGVHSDLENDLMVKRKEISTLLKDMNEKDRNNLLLSLLVTNENKTSEVTQQKSGMTFSE